MLIGCGRQAARTPGGVGDLLAIGPDQTLLAAARPDYILAAIEAAGGLPTWMQCVQLDLRGVVTAYGTDTSYYLTEHVLAVYPWSQAVRISAREPQSEFVWEMVRDRFELLKGDASLDASPLAGSYPGYAAAVLQIVTVPARLLDRAAQLTRQPLPVQIRGQDYDPIEVRFAVHPIVAETRKEPSVATESYWTSAVYYQNRQTARIDMICLANPARKDFLVVRGYDYAAVPRDGVFVPTKIEVFRSDPEGRIGRRFVQIDLVM
jgi:hypothetical protein